MGTFLSIFAFLLAGAGCVLAWRARRASLRLALEMIQLRDRLAQAEEGRALAEEAVALARTHREAPDPDLLARLIEVESQVRDAASARPSSVANPAVGLPAGASTLAESEDQRMHVRQQLEQRGFERVSILGAAEDGRYLVEAVRRGVVSKGHAELAPDGTLYWRSMSSLRAFP